MKGVADRFRDELGEFHITDITWVYPTSFRSLWTLQVEVHLKDCSKEPYGCQVEAKTPEEAADLLINKVLGTLPVQPQKKTQWERLLDDD
jgi:hypothetical protein